jgi:small subunit ribosomal protein S2
MPYVAGRWIGGTITNHEQMMKRVRRYEDLVHQKEKGELAKYTKRERLMIDREIESLHSKFGGILTMKELPGCVCVVDPSFEDIAVAEANEKNIPVIGIASTDCDVTNLTQVIPANDSSRDTIAYILQKIADTYQSALE